MIGGLELLYSERQVNEAFDSMVIEFNNIVNKGCCFIMVLKGGVFTGFELLQHLSLDLIDQYGFIGVSSYVKTDTKPSVFKLTYELDLDISDIKGKQIWLVDDIVDSGNTMQFIVTDLLDKGINADNIHVCTLVERQGTNKFILGDDDIIGIKHTGNEFLVGCGMGLGELYRGLLGIYSFNEDNRKDK